MVLLLEAAEEELLAFMAFPREHWTKLRSTNPLERLNKEIARRSDVVGIYPNDASLVRLVGALLIEQNDEWLVGRQRAGSRNKRHRSSRPARCAPTDVVDADQHPVESNLIAADRT